MPDRPFQIGGATVPPMIGRKAIIHRVVSALSKATPDHLQVVGPRLGGKTVLLNAFANQMRVAGSQYKTIVLWDLAHFAPDSNEAFICAFRDHIAEAVAPINKDYSDLLISAGNSPYKEVCEVFDALWLEKVKVLMLWDGFDKPLANGRLTRNLWDQLRDLASRPNLRLVTATRRPLHELIRDEDTQTSDFWGIFESTVRVGCFDDEDMNEAISALEELKFAPGARAELQNWTGGFPPLTLSLLNALQSSVGSASIDGNTVNRVAEDIGDEVEGFLAVLWGDCPEPSKDLFREVVNAKGLEASAARHSDLSHLAEKGFLKRSGANLISDCRFLERYIARDSSETGYLSRLFGSDTAFRTNIRPLLETRLSNFSRLDASLKRYIQRGIEDLPDHPEVCVSNVRGIVDRALDIIWAAELGSARTIPAQYFTDWQFEGEKGPEQHWDHRFPVRRGHQVRLLQLITGTDKSRPKAKFVTKNTYCLVNAAQGFGDFGQHLDGAKVDLSVASAAMNVCLELAACLERELGSSPAKE